MSKELDELLSSHQDRVDALERAIDAQSKHIDALSKINEIEKERHNITKEVLKKIVSEYFEYKAGITKYMKILKNDGVDLSRLGDDFFSEQEKREIEIRNLVAAIIE